MPAQPRRLAAYLATAYLGLVVYATLYPFSGWRDLGVSPFGFLVPEWPRYWTLTDALFNTLAYVPLGFLLSALWQGRLPPKLAALFSFCAGALLSFALETVQNWLPTRDPAILDLLANSLGAALGSLCALRWGERWLRRQARWQHQHLTNLPHVELGLLLTLLWLVCQLFPTAIPLGMGDVRYLLGMLPNGAFEPHHFQRMSTWVVAGNLVAAGLLWSLLAPDRLRCFLGAAALFLLTLLLRCAGQIWQQPDTLSWQFSDWLIWAGPAQQEGGVLAITLLSVLLFTPRALRAILAGLAVLIATVLVNLTPVDPYSKLASATGLSSFFFNVQNLAHGLAALWPFLALPYLLFVSRRL